MNGDRDFQTVASAMVACVAIICWTAYAIARMFV